MCNDQFGWVEVKDEFVIAYVGDSRNPTIHKFSNEEIVKAVKFYKNMKGLVEGYAESPEISLHSIGRRALSEFT